MALLSGFGNRLTVCDWIVTLSAVRLETSGNYIFFSEFSKLSTRCDGYCSRNHLLRYRQLIQTPLCMYYTKMMFDFDGGFDLKVSFQVRCFIPWSGYFQEILFFLWDFFKTSKVAENYLENSLDMVLRNKLQTKLSTLRTQCFALGFRAKLRQNANYESTN